MSKKKPKRKNKRLKEKLLKEKRERKYAERDATLWCDVVLEQDDALDTKDIIIADLTAEIEKLKAPTISVSWNGEPYEIVTANDG